MDVGLIVDVTHILATVVMLGTQTWQTGAEHPSVIIL